MTTPTLPAAIRSSDRLAPQRADAGTSRIWTAKLRSPYLFAIEPSKHPYDFVNRKPIFEIF